MNSIVSQLIRNQVTRENQQSGMEQMIALHHLLDNGIRATNASQKMNISQEDQERLRDAWVHIILSSLEVTEQTLLFAKEDANPVEIFLTNLHREFHLDVDSVSEDNVIIYPVVAKDLSALYFLFEGAEVPIKIIDFTTKGNEYHVSIVDTRNISAYNLYTQSAANDPESMLSLCIWAKTRELRSDPFSSALLDIVLGMS